MEVQSVVGSLPHFELCYVYHAASCPFGSLVKECTKKSHANTKSDCIFLHCLHAERKCHQSLYWLEFWHNRTHRTRGLLICRSKCTDVCMYIHVHIYMCTLGAKLCAHRGVQRNLRQIHVHVHISTCIWTLLINTCVCTCKLCISIY